MDRGNPTPSLAAVAVIGDPEALRALAHPLRLRLLERLRSGGPQTVKQLAAALDVGKTTLYYHVRLLQKHALIQVVDTRLVSGLVEKRYAVVARRLSVDKTMLETVGDGGRRSGLDVFLSVVLDEVRAEIERAVDAGLIDLGRAAEDRIAADRLVIGRKWYRMTPDQVDAFDRAYRTFADTVAAFDTEPDPPGDAAAPQEQRLYEWLIAFYPTAPPGSNRDGNDPTG